MDYVKNPYLLVMPEGKAMAVPDIEYVKAYVNSYYEEKAKKFTVKEEFSEYDINDDEVRDEILIRIGNDDGRPILYDMEDFLEQLRTMEIFQDDVDEIVLAMEKQKFIDIKKYELEDVLVNSKVVEFDN